MNYRNFPGLVLFPLLFGTSHCGSENDENQEETPVEETTVFARNGANSLGISEDDYDHAIVVGNPTSKTSLRLLDENESDESEEAPVQVPSETEIQQCSDHFGQVVSGISISGNETTSEIDNGQLIAVKLSGNKSTVNLLLTARENVESEEASSETPSLKGVCVIASGNQPKVNVVVNGVSVSKVFYKASGNQPAATFEVGKESELSEFVGTISGNQASLTIQGEGDFSCEKVTVTGNSIEPSCVKTNGSPEESD